MTNAAISMQGMDKASGVTYSGEDFINNPQAFNNINSPFSTQARCSGKGNAMSFMGRIRCRDLFPSTSETVNADNESCTALKDCTFYSNDTLSSFFFGTCAGWINNSYYGINSNLSYSTKYCAASGLQTEEMCRLFQCSWINASDQFASSVNAGSVLSTVSIWETIGWVITFKYDYGFDPFFNVIINFILAVIIPLILFISLYFMFVPF